jgi:DNA end-binding protein Ku
MAREPETEEQEAPKPFWSGVVTFGLVSLPVSLFPATRGNTLRLRMVDAEGTFLSRRFFSGDDLEPLDPDDLARGYEVETDRFIVIEDEELEALDPEKSREIDLGKFVAIDELDPVHFERPYFLVPDGGTTKAYRLLAKTMEEEQRAGIATFVMRGKEYLCAILAERGILRAETLRFRDEVRTPEAIGLPPKQDAETRTVSELAKAIKSLHAKHLDRAQLTDRHTKRIVALAEKKRKSGIDVVESGEDEQEAKESATDVIDLMQVLKERLEGKARARRASGGGKSAAAEPPNRLEERSKADLYAMAQDRGIPGRSAMTKRELIKAIRRRTDRTG